MIAPWAKETHDEYRISGRVLQIFYDRAELGPADLQGTAWSPDDSVRLFLETISMEDHFRSWDTTMLPYRLSLTYLARVVGLEPGEAEEVPPGAEAYLGGSGPRPPTRAPTSPGWATASPPPSASWTPSLARPSGSRWRPKKPASIRTTCTSSDRR
jgi:hypothetical protein